MSGTSGRASPQVEVHDADVVGARAAERVAERLRHAVSRRGRATVAFSGGSTPTPMFDALATADVPWSSVHVLQVDERMAPQGHSDRNLTTLRARLLDRVPIPDGNVHPVPADLDDAGAAASAYAETLLEVVGDPPVIDLVHLGLGADGHTASLVPDDAALDEHEALAAATSTYEGRRRVTMTLPVLRAARLQLWLVAGSDKAAALAGLRRGDDSLPATAVLTDDAVVLLDNKLASRADEDTSN